MRTQETTIRSALVSDMERLLEWARDEGWNPGLDDTELFRQIDPNGFFMAFENDRSVAGISVVKHDDRNRKSGFERAYRNIRYAGGSCSLLTSVMSVPESDSNLECRAITHSDWPDLVEMDSRVHGYSRERMLKHWLTECPTRISRICTQDGRVAGFTSIRQCHEGFKIRPLIGNSPSVACVLLKAHVERAGASTIILDIPEPNSAALELASSIGLWPVFETARMYKGQGPRHELHSLFAESSLELG